MNHKKRSGHDVDIWGDGSRTRPRMVPRPGEPGPCPRAVDRRCPPGCDECVQFADEIGQYAALRAAIDGTT
jgi:hypothetical protein